MLTLLSAPSSLELRRVMFDIIAALPIPFQPERLGRFDQQVTSRFHRDGAPAESLLLLGYEPSDVASTLSFADAPAAASERGMDIDAFLASFNPMFPPGEAVLSPFVTSFEIPKRTACIAMINNSLMSMGGNPLGVLHKAEVPRPDPEARRVINSIGLARTGPFKPADVIRRFLERSDLD